jgi:uncharacterized membrane protein YhaH (DUF805 family)
MHLLCAQLFYHIIAIMGEFVNGFWNKLISILLSIVVIGINIAFIVSRLDMAKVSGWVTVLVGGYF